MISAFSLGFFACVNLCDVDDNFGGGYTCFCEVATVVHRNKADIRWLAVVYLFVLLRCQLMYGFGVGLELK